MDQTPWKLLEYINKNNTEIHIAYILVEEGSQ